MVNFRENFIGKLLEKLPGKFVEFMNNPLEKTCW